MSKNPSFGTPLDSQDIKESQILLKSAWQDFYHVFSSLSSFLSRKMSLLVIYELLGLFINTLAANDKYFFRIVTNCGNQFKCNHLKNKKIFLNVLLHYWNLHSILNFVKKDDPQSLYISKITDCKRRG